MCLSRDTVICQTNSIIVMALVKAAFSRAFVYLLRSFLNSVVIVAQRSEVGVFIGVCLFVCQHENFRTIKHRMMKLGDQMRCTKISPEFECQGERSRSPGTIKNENVQHFVRDSSSEARSLRSSVAVFRERSSGRRLLRRWENQRMLSSSLVHADSDSHKATSHKAKAKAILRQV